MYLWMSDRLALGRKYFIDSTKIGPSGQLAWNILSIEHLKKYCAFNDMN